MRLFPLGYHDCRFDLLGQLICIPDGPPRPIAEPFQAALFIALEDFVAGLSRYPELTAQRSHIFTVLEPDHKTHPFVDHRTLLPRHGLHPPWGTKCNPCLRNVLLPMSRNGQTVRFSFGLLPFSTTSTTLLWA